MLVIAWANVFQTSSPQVCGIHVERAQACALGKFGRMRKSYAVRASF